MIMILTGPQISLEVSRGTIKIAPFNDLQLNPNSYNVRLGRTLVVYDEDILDPALPNRHRILTMHDCGVVLSPHRIYLGATVETIGSDEYVPIIRARSSTARLGLFVHVTADLID